MASRVCYPLVLPGGVKILCEVSNLARQLSGQALVSSLGVREGTGVAPANLNSSGARQRYRAGGREGGGFKSLYAVRVAGCLARQQ